MKPKEIQDLIDFISKSELDEVHIETDEFKIKVRKSVRQKVVGVANTVAPQVQQSAAPVATQAPVVDTAAAPKESETDNGYVTIKSPMIGTFYRSANPESESFVNVGDTIGQGNTVCIIEAMKLFNEIEAEISGTIIKILVDNASPVEYDQPLFLVDPA